MNYQIRAQAAPWKRGVEFVMKYGRAFANNVTLEEISEGSMIPILTTLDYEDAQTLMDDLWNAGLRPTEGSGSAGALAATQRHLEDMRTLVFKKPDDR